MRISRRIELISLLALVSVLAVVWKPQREEPKSPKPRLRQPAKIETVATVPPEDEPLTVPQPSWQWPNSDLDQNATYYRKIYEQDTGNHKAYHDWIVTMTMSGGRSKEAVVHLRRSVRDRGPCKSCYQIMALSYARIHDFDRSYNDEILEATRQAFELDPTEPYSILEYAHALRACNQETVAVEVLREGLRSAPDQLRLKTDLAYLLPDSDPQKETLLTELVEQQPYSDQAAYHRAWYYGRIQEYSKAEADYDLAVERSIGNWERCSNLKSRGKFLEGRGRWTDAFKDLKASQESPGGSSSLEIAEFLERWKGQKHALSYLNTMVAKEPLSYTGYATRGEYHEKIGNKELAAQDYEVTAELVEKFSRFIYWKGYVEELRERAKDLRA